jgi:hypothetical protein
VIAIVAPVWMVCALVIIVAGVRSRHSARATTVGRYAFVTLFLGAGAAVNAIFLATGEDYADFADSSYIPFVRHTWRTLVVPNHWLFILVLIAFEAAVGLLALRGGRLAQWGLAAAIAFHIGLLFFGWGFYLWSIPMISAFVLLLRAARRQPDVPVASTNEYSTAA